jgi:hypothetical protein
MHDREKSLLQVKLVALDFPSPAPRKASSDWVAAVELRPCNRGLPDFYVDKAKSKEPAL